MRDHSTTVSPSSAIRNGVLILRGYGIRVFVERGHLVCSDGYCDVRRRMRLHRATCGLRRLVLLGSSGFITLEGVRWLHHVDAALVQIGDLGEVLLASGPQGLDDARLRRAQALAPAREVGLRITREILRAKFEGQARVLDTLGAGPIAATLRRAASTLDSISAFDRLRLIEADSAAALWETLAPIPFPFARRDARLVPDTWRTVGPRSSPLTGQPRLAATPAHAIWNYLFAVAESECRIAARAVGLDTGMGILHVDQPARDSMALDLLEVVRPRVDACVLGMLRERVFSRDDFEETRRGVCRVLPPLTRHLAETGPRWARELAPWAERVASLLMADASERRNRTHRVPTPLTQTNRSAGRNRVRRQPARVPHVPAMPHACRECGVLLDDPDRRQHYCDDCRPARKREVATSILTASRAALGRLRAMGRDPAHGGEAARARGAKVGRANRERARWGDAVLTAAHVLDSVAFRRDVLPGLRRVRLSRIARTLDVSRGYASFIRRGLKTPHPRHFAVLRKLAQGGETMRTE